MKLLFSLLLILYGINLSAQVQPIYFRGDKVIKDKNQATSYGVYGKLSNEELWVLKRYDLYNNLMQTGTYKDESLSIPHGKFTFYQDVNQFNDLHLTYYNLKGKYRFVCQQGSFVDGLEQGRWITFFPDGNVMSITDFVNGKMHGETRKYNKRGEVEIDGHYVDGERDGEWIFQKDKKILVYEKGVLKATKEIPKVKK